MRDGTYDTDRNNAMVLGEGAYARVLRGRDKSTKETVAIKEVMKHILIF